MIPLTVTREEMRLARTWVEDAIAQAWRRRAETGQAGEAASTSSSAP